METQEAYQELGLDPSASDAQLKATWRRLVAAWHPDRNAAADAGRRMQSINKAYQHIRQLRDGDGEEASDSEPPPGETAAPASDAPPPPPRASHSRKVRLSLEEAILGCTRTLRGHFTHHCDDCLGKGVKVLAQACGTCKGSGAVRSPALFGWYWNETDCTDCSGDGRQREHCSSCNGKGEHPIHYRRRVRFPPGLRAGHVLSVPTTRHGALDIGLELEIEIEEHPLFVVGQDGVLRCEMPVNGYAWMANHWVEVPTPDGMQQMRLNRDALAYRLGGQGMPDAPRGPRGDYLVKIVPVFPAQEDPEQTALLEQLIAASSRSAEADRAHALNHWKSQLKRWNNQQKEAVRED